MTDAPQLDGLIAKVGNIPVIPKVAEKIIHLVEDVNTTSTQLQEVIDTDQGIASRLLKIANSAFYGYRGGIKTTTEAVRVLGFKTIRSLVLAASLREVYKRFGLTEKLLWEHSLFTSISSRAIASTLELPYVEDAFVAGLMHNVGMVVMNNERPDDFSIVMQRFYNEDIPLLEVEREVFGFTHNEAGALTVRKWKLADFLEKVIYYQDSPDVFEGHDEYLYVLASIVYLSNRLCYRLGIGLGTRKQKEIDLATDKVVRGLKLSPVQMDGLLERVREIYEVEKEGMA